MRKKVLLIILLWTIIVVGWVLKNEYTLHTGREVILATVPVDPRDILMGDYVILGFAVGEVQSTQLKKHNPDLPVYVYLNVDERNIAKRSKITQIQPDLKNNDLYLKGKINGNRIKFGIENYYVKEKTGKVLENKLRHGGFVKVKIDKFGNAQIVGFVDKFKN